MSDTEIFDFPCAFPIKVMGRQSDEFASLVTELVERHVDDLAPDAVSVRESSKGAYLAVTVTVTARSREQLDNIYRELTGHELILMVL